MNFHYFEEMSNIFNCQNCRSDENLIDCMNCSITTCLKCTKTCEICKRKYCIYCADDICTLLQKTKFVQYIDGVTNITNEPPSKGTFYKKHYFFYVCCHS